MDQFYSSVGERVRELRIKENLSQEELSERAYLSVVHLSNIERGAKKPSLDAVLRIAKALGVDAARILTSTPSNESVYQALSSCEHQLEQTAAYIRQALKELEKT